MQKNFRIVSTSTSQQINYINGTLQQTKQWAFGLQPLHTGKITINPIKIGGINSNYEEVEVKEVSDVAYVPDSQENTNSPYFQINLSYSPESPYLQQQTTFLVTIYDSLGLQDSALSITEETDAVAVVVSEESGIISVAYKGRLIRDFNEITLTDTLEDLMIRRDTIISNVKNVVMTKKTHSEPEIENAFSDGSAPPEEDV